MFTHSPTQTHVFCSANNNAHTAAQEAQQKRIDSLALRASEFEQLRVHVALSTKIISLNNTAVVTYTYRTILVGVVTWHMSCMSRALDDANRAQRPLDFFCASNKCMIFSFQCTFCHFSQTKNLYPYDFINCLVLKFR